MFGLGVLLTACSDDDDTPSYTKNETTISAQKWQLKDVVWTDTLEVDSSVFQDCLADDWIKFDLNHDFSFTSDSLDCSTDSLSLPYGDGAWAFNFEEDSIALQFSDTTLHWAVDELTESALQLSYSDSVGESYVKKTLQFEPAVDTTE